MLIIRNIFAQSITMIMLIIISIICYISSFIAPIKVMNWILFITFYFLRIVCAKIMGVKIIYKGLDNIPEGAVIFASKHQSAFEGSFFFNEFKRNTVYCFKAEIAKVPLWGRMARCNGGISVSRGNISSFRKFIKDVQTKLNEGKSVAIFPEGTRVKPTEAPSLKGGISKIYKHTTAPIVPVALNTGDCFPKGARVLRSTNIIIEFLPAINRDMSEDEFTDYLHKVINEKSDELHKLSNVKLSKEYLQSK